MRSAPEVDEAALNLAAKAVLAAGGDMKKAAHVLGVPVKSLAQRARKRSAKDNVVHVLAVSPDAPKEIVGMQAIAAALSRSTDWVKDHMNTDDPIPVRYTVRGLAVRRERLELWVLRLGKHVVPVEDLGVLKGYAALAKALGVSVPSLKNYMRPTAPFGRLPVWKHKGLCWAYRDALVDWLDSQKMGLIAGRMLRGSARLRQIQGDGRDPDD